MEEFKYHTKGTGIYVQPTNKNRIPEFNPRKAEHFIVMQCTFTIDVERLARSGGVGTLDHENMVGIVGPICYHCEQPFSTDLLVQPCKGHP
jgi:hypothetical protein